MTTRLTTTAPESTPTLPELEAARRTAAFNAEEGVPGAAEQLTAAEAALAEARTEQERMRLADEERRARAAAADAAARAEREAAARARVAALVAERWARAGTLDAALDTVKSEIQQFQRVERDLAATVATLPPPVATRVMNRLALAGAVTWALTEQAVCGQLRDVVLTQVGDAARREVRREESRRLASEAMARAAGIETEKILAEALRRAPNPLEPEPAEPSPAERAKRAEAKELHEKWVAEGAKADVVVSQCWSGP